MKKLLFIVCFLPLWVTAQTPLQVGKVIENIVLPDVNGKEFNLKDQVGKGVVLIFSTPSCEYCQMYETRILNIHHKFKAKGYSVVAISPYMDDPKNYPKDAPSLVKKWINEHKIPYPFLADQRFKYAGMFGIKQTPEAVVLKKIAAGFEIKYIGLIDDNAQLKKPNPANFLEKILNSL